VECAICYSYVSSLIVSGFALMLVDRIIEVTDGTLPKKPCRTCKNRFHASCLYKVSAKFASLLYMC
jgi:hypothetical protein